MSENFCFKLRWTKFPFKMKPLRLAVNLDVKVGVDSDRGSDVWRKWVLFASCRTSIFASSSVLVLSCPPLVYSPKELRCEWTWLNEWNDLRLYFSSRFDFSNRKCPYWSLGWHCVSATEYVVSCEILSNGKCQFWLTFDIGVTERVDAQ